MLSHLRVVDCATFIAGPSTSTLLADFGASVVRIEPPWGDPWRGAAFGISGAYPYDTTNRNKRCISLDLKRPEAREVLRRLVKGADVFVTNALPSSRERMGIDYASLSALNPRLIYASVSAYGERGPEADAPGFDPQAYWARSGMLSILRTSPIPGTGDHPTAVSLVAGVLLALYNRERTGKGSHVSTALLANGLWAAAAPLHGDLNGEPSGVPSLGPGLPGPGAVAADAQPRECGFFAEFEDGKGSTVRCPFRVEGEEGTGKAPTRAPGLGEHTEEVLGELGFASEEIVGLARVGAVGIPRRRRSNL